MGPQLFADAATAGLTHAQAERLAELAGGGVGGPGRLKDPALKTTPLWGMDGSLFYPDGAQEDEAEFEDAVDGVQDPDL